MSEPLFATTERRSFVVPGLIALAVLAAAFFVATRLYPATRISASLLGTRLLPTKTVYKSDTIVIGANETDSTLFVVPTVRIDNKLRTSATFDDATLVLTDGTGAQLTAKAAEKSGLPNLALMFPLLKPLMNTPLLRDTEMPPGQSTQGSLVFSFPVTQDLWEHRASAVLTLDIYHQPSITVPLAKP